jgi:hypothetical protein
MVIPIADVQNNIEKNSLNNRALVDIYGWLVVPLSFHIGFYGFWGVLREWLITGMTTLLTEYICQYFLCTTTLLAQ